MSHTSLHTPNNGASKAEAEIKAAEEAIEVAVQLVKVKQGQVTKCKGEMDKIVKQIDSLDKELLEVHGTLSTMASQLAEQRAAIHDKIEQIVLSSTSTRSSRVKQS